jgi:acyl carrier protein
MPENDDLIQRVIKVIAKSQHLPPESISADATFEELKIDSLDGITILFELEGEFDVDIPDDQARSINSVRDVIEGIRRLLALKSASGAAPAAASPA